MASAHDTTYSRVSPKIARLPLLVKIILDGTKLRLEPGGAKTTTDGINCLFRPSSTFHNLRHFSAFSQFDSAPLDVCGLIASASICALSISGKVESVQIDSNRPRNCPWQGKTTWMLN